MTQLIQLHSVAAKCQLFGWFVQGQNAVYRPVFWIFLKALPDVVISAES